MLKKSDSRSTATPEVADPGELRRSAAAECCRDIEIRISPASAAGPVKAVHGVTNFAPLQHTAMTFPTPVLEMVRALHLPYSYFHDAPLENPGMDLIDISRLFPIFSADVDDPASYRFAENDEYLRRVIESGTGVIFRLGETIEVGAKKFRVTPPADFEKWAKICVNIARHYNEGWANGFHWDIRDWAIWEEPNNPNLWGGDFKQYLELYAVTSRLFKARFPELNIGGPETTTLGVKFLEEFLDFCRDEKPPLDFVSYTAYYHTPAEYLAETRKRRRMLDERGFENIPLWINEWHASPVWSSFADPVGYGREIERIGGVNGAVFAAAILCGLQDAPIERACFYSTAMPGGYGIFDARRLPTPVYYVFEKFCMLFDRACHRVAVETVNGCPDILALATKNNSGGIDLLIAAYVMDCRNIRIPIPAGFTVAAAELLDDDHRRFTAIDPGRQRRENGVLELLKPECAAAFFVELRRI